MLTTYNLYTASDHNAVYARDKGTDLDERASADANGSKWKQHTAWDLKFTIFRLLVCTIKANEPGPFLNVQWSLDIMKL